MKLYAKGKRGLVYKQGRRIIKVEKPGSKAVNRLENEAKWLKKLNKKSIGPKFIKFEEGKLYMEFIDGKPILDYCEGKRKEIVVKVLVDLVQQCRVMDKLGVNKFEMHHPLKHVLIRKGKVVMIDFERCRNSVKPKNVTQVCQFLSRYFDVKGILGKAKAYKETYSEKEYKEILKCLINT